MAATLVGGKVTDPATFVAIAVLFFVIAGVASWLPAWRAPAWIRMRRYGDRD